ncbi:MAG: hypothetical protein GTO54_12245 [Nitrososphaeria archaeon]|nr:hypothetical protein [Nitrososphaeria archaeon]
MKLGSKLLLKQLYKEYYFHNKEIVAREIMEINQREFGCNRFEEETLIRHLAFENQNELAEFLVKTVPKDFYHSAAYYLFPEREMYEKEWLAADLIFDIDADHLHEKDLRPSVFYLCEECGEISGEGGNPCGRCGGILKEVSWIGERELEVARKETVRLVRILREELGFSEEEIDVYFSGGRGFHVYVISEESKKLTSEERVEITDYIRLTGYDLRYEDERRRTAQRISAILGEEEERFLDELMEDETKIFLTSTRGLESGKSMDLRASLNHLKTEIPPRIWDKMERYVVRREMVEIDPVVTTDTHRLIRSSMSLHGKTGLVKKPIDDLDAFDPLTDAVALTEDEIRVKVEYSPQIRLGDREFGPFHREVVSVPAYLAVFMVGRGVADVE